MLKSQPCKLHRDEVPWKKNNTFPTRHNFEEATRVDEQSFRKSLSSEVWQFAAGASELSATSIFRTPATLLRDHTMSHLNNHHLEFLKSHTHQFQDRSTYLGITVILFFGVNAFPYTTGFPQGQWRTQEFCSGGSTNSVEDRGQWERRSEGGSPLGILEAAVIW